MTISYQGSNQGRLLREKDIVFSNFHSFNMFLFMVNVECLVQRIYSPFGCSRMNNMDMNPMREHILYSKGCNCTH